MFATSSFIITFSSPSTCIQAPCSHPRSLLHAPFSYSAACGFIQVSIFIPWITQRPQVGLSVSSVCSNPSLHPAARLIILENRFHVTQCWRLPIALRIVYTRSVGIMRCLPVSYLLLFILFLVVPAFFGSHSLPLQIDEKPHPVCSGVFRISCSLLSLLAELHAPAWT